jgi:hypothetical protein
MSHVAAVKLEVHDTPEGLAALKAACAELGLQFMEGQKQWEWYGRWVQDYHGQDAAYKLGIDPSTYGTSEHAIRLPGCEYEIGVVRNKEGKLTLAYDFFGPGQKILQALGKGLEKLSQHYGLNRAQMLARNRGLITQRKPQENGDIKLVITGKL